VWPGAMVCCGRGRAGSVFGFTTSRLWQVLDVQYRSTTPCRMSRQKICETISEDRLGRSTCSWNRLRDLTDLAVSRFHSFVMQSTYQLDSISANECAYDYPCAKLIADPRGLG